MLKEQLIPEPETILDEAIEIEKPRSAALFCLLYLTAGRISEVIEIRRKNIIRKTLSKRPAMVIQLPNRKHKKRHWKQIPIPLDKRIYIKMYKIIREYTHALSREEKLFDIGKRRAQQIITKEFGINAHLFRHIRLTHLAQDFTEQELIHYAGWTDSRSAKHYVHFNVKNLMKKL